MNRDQIILAWQKAKRELDTVKKLESELRKAVITECFPQAKTGEPVDGTTTLELGNDYQLKAAFKLSYKLDNKNNAVKEALSQLTSLMENGPEVVEKLVTWEPKLNKKVYDNLNTDCKNIFDNVVTVTQSAPTVSLVEPKGE